MMHTKKTSVLWDINGCPIPGDFDPRLVGPRIESALKKSGFSGPLTITAVGALRQTGDKVLQDLSSTGISLEHNYGVDLVSWHNRNPPPATIMLITSLSTLEVRASALYDLIEEGYTVLLACPQRDEAREWLWKSFLRCVTKEWLWKSLLEDGMDETTRPVLQDKSPLSFSCNLCRFSGQSFDDFATHLKSASHAYTEWDCVASKTNVNRFENKPEPPDNDPDTIKELNRLYDEGMERRYNRNYTVTPPDYSMRIPEDIAKIKISLPKKETLVLWDINGCPIPDGFDPRLVSQRILSAFNSLGWWPPGPLTITAIGDLSQIPSKVQQELSATGITLVHTYRTEDIETHLNEWTHLNPSPASLMLISGPLQLRVLAEKIYHLVEFDLYSIYLAYPQRDQDRDWLWKSFLRSVSKDWLWKSLLEDEMDSGTADDIEETTRLVLQDKCSETGDSRWSFSLCQFAGQSSEDLTTHLKSQGHAYSKNNNKTEEEADTE